MKNLFGVSCLLVIFLACSAFSFKKHAKKEAEDIMVKQVYVVGMSASFVDSTVYYTDIQTINDVKLIKRKMLPHRDQLSLQLYNHLQNVEPLDHRVCFMYFNVNKKKLEKSMRKTLERYKNTKSVKLKQVDKSFRFVKPEEQTVEEEQ